MVVLLYSILEIVGNTVESSTIYECLGCPTCLFSVVTFIFRPILDFLLFDVTEIFVSDISIFWF